MAMDGETRRGVPRRGGGGGLPRPPSVRLSLGIALHALACVATAFGNPGSSSTQGGGLTVTHFGNTAMAGPGRPTVAHTLENVPTESPAPATSGPWAPGRPSSITVTGRLAPPKTRQLWLRVELRSAAGVPVARGVCPALGQRRDALPTQLPEPVDKVGTHTILRLPVSTRPYLLHGHCRCHSL